MKCIHCDNKSSLKKQVVKKKYTECGLDNVILEGVDFYRCNKCGEEYYGYGDQDQLHTLIARALLFKNGVIKGNEARFLRTYLGYSSSFFSEAVGYTKETISRYENDQIQIPRRYNILLKALVATKLPDRNYNFHDKLLNDSEHKKNFKSIVVDKRNGWHLKNAA